MIDILLSAAGIVLISTAALSAILLAFNHWAPTHMVQERHDGALAVFILIPIIFLVALQPAPAQPAPLQPALTETSFLEGNTIDNLIATSENKPSEQALVSTPSSSIPTQAISLNFLGISPLAIIAAIWLFGSTFMATRLIRDIVSLRNLRDQSHSAELPDHIKLSRKIVLRQSDQVSTPLIAGYFTPTVIIPPDFKFDNQACPVLEHEIAHLDRRDQWIVLGLRILTTLFWWAIPLYTLLPIINQSRETLCDMTAATITKNPHRLAHALLDAATRNISAPALALAATHDRSTLAARIEHLSSPHAATRRQSMIKLPLMITTLAATAIIFTPHVGAATVQNQFISSDYADDSRHPHGGNSHHTGNIDNDHGPSGDLFRAAARGRMSHAVQAIENGANVNAVYSGDGTALIAASHRGHSEIVDLLLTNDADPNITVSGDGSPLISAAQRGDVGLIHMLLAAGADANLSIRGDGNPLIAAAQHNHIDALTVLLEAGANPNTIVPGDETPLINAAQQGNVQIAELLLEAGVDLSLTVEVSDRSRGGPFRSAISEARRFNHTEMIQWLEAHGAQHQPSSN